MSSAIANEPGTSLGKDFWKFWAARTISSLGGSFTLFALPLLVFELTGSAVSLGLATAVSFLPYLLFGVLIGTWMDRIDRKRFMIVADIARALTISSIPYLAVLDSLAVWWIYVVGFANSTIKIGFDAGQFAALPSLVSRENLVRANGRLQAAWSTVSLIGPLLAGQLVTVVATSTVLLFDSLSFLISAGILALTNAGFNQPSDEEAQTSFRQDLTDGLRYLLTHPVLRNISIMLTLVNLLAITTMAQLVLFAKQQLQANDAQISLLYAAGGGGLLVLSLLADPLRKYFRFSTVALGSIILYGLLIAGMALTHLFWVATMLWALISGLVILFNINLDSLQQAIVPDHMLGRVRSIDNVLAWSAIPLGSLLGGLAIEQTRDVSLVYGTIGVLIFFVGLVSCLTSLGRAERYLPKNETEEAR